MCFILFLSKLLKASGRQAIEIWPFCLQGSGAFVLHAYHHPSRTPFIPPSNRVHPFETVGIFDKCETPIPTGHIHHLPSDNSWYEDLWLIKPNLLLLLLPFLNVKLRFSMSTFTIYHPAADLASLSIVPCHHCLRFECFTFHCGEEEFRVTPKKHRLTIA